MGGQPREEAPFQMTEVTMPTIPEILEIAARYPTNMADAMFAACVEKAAETSDAAPRKDEGSADDGS